MLRRAESGSGRSMAGAAFAVATIWPVAIVMLYVLQANTDPWWPWRVVAVLSSVVVGALPMLLSRWAGRRAFLVAAVVWGAGAVVLFPFLGLGLLLVPLAVSYGMLATLSHDR